MKSLASDGKYIQIYCLDRKNAGLNVFSIDEDQNVGIVQYHPDLCMRFKTGTVPTDEYYPNLIPKTVGDASVITNEIVVQFSLYMTL